MRTMRFTWYLPIAAIVLASSALSHEGETPHGEAVSGTITTVSPEALTLDTGKGSVEITLTERTKLTRDERPVGRDALQPGVHVMVRGSKVPGGGLVAREVIVHPMEAERADP